MKKGYLTTKGYTIIETMIAISVFLVIVVAGMGALLNANLVHKKSQDVRSILDNLNFIMDDMSKNLRLGSVYHCVDDGNFTSSSLTTAHSCVAGTGMAFKNSVDGSTWAYRIEFVSNDASGLPVYTISKFTDTGGQWVQLTPIEVNINSISGFSVLGAEGADTQQPFVIMRLIGTITFKGVSTPFSLQTSVSQRLVDI